MTTIKSEIKEEPLFSFRNFFRPTSRNVLSWSTIIKGLCITGMATAFASANGWVFGACLVLGGLADAFIYFTGEKPVSTLYQAVENIEEDKIIEQTEAHE